MDLAANSKAQVYLDGKLIGATPVTVSGLAHGSHEIRMTDPGRNQSNIYRFYIPDDHAAKSHIVANFDGNGPEWNVVESAGTWPSRTSMSAEAHTHGASTETRVQARTQTKVEADDGVNEKARMRNISLGLGALGVLTDSAELKGAGLGGVILNEIINK